MFAAIQPSLTLALLLTHDGVAEGEQAEKLVSVCVAHFHRFQQGVVIETEVGVRQGVEGSEVQPLKVNGKSGTLIMHHKLKYVCFNKTLAAYLWLRSQRVCCSFT